ncbi:MAG: hypothetical protein IJY27_01830 [Clostridia bacterium]|nr:hypothetical protein [Clostridia bacterium]
MNVSGYFAASNSGCGFKNYYPNVFGGADRIYVIKGGPGTGKSRFMRDISDYAVERGWRCEHYLCSSDPASLDGILLSREGQSIAVIDGTPPHAWEPDSPGVREEIVNLGEFWNADALREHAAELESLNKQKKACWRRAYKWLEGCLDMCGIIRGIGERLVDGERVRDRAQSILEGVADGDGFSMRTALIDSVGMQGRAHSNEFYDRAQTLYIVRDSFMSANLLLRCCIEQARLKGLGTVVSYDPIDPERVDGVLIESRGLAIVVSDDTPEREYIAVDMADLCVVPNTESADEARRAEQCYDSMLAGATDALADVRRYHFEVEKIYVQAMDFEAKQRFTAEFCRKTFS